MCLMEPITAITGGVLVAVVSGVVGKALGNRNGVKNSLCDERRHACSTLIIEKIDNLTHMVTDLRKVVLKQNNH